MRRSPGLLCLGLLLASVGLMSPLPHALRRAARPQSRGVSHVKLDLSDSHPVSPTLFGIFFEEINFAGDGGLYAEMVNDRSFDAWAARQASGRPQATAAARRLLQRQTQAQGVPLLQGRLAWQKDDDWSDGPGPWSPIGEQTVLQPTSDAPLGAGNPVALSISAGTGSSGTAAGVANTGYWAISIQPGAFYHLSLYLKQPASDTLSHKVTVALQSADGAKMHGQLLFSNITSEWQRYQGVFQLGLNATADPTARLAVLFKAPGSLLVDLVSLFPEENVERGMLNPWPFRADLLQMLKDLQPRFVRFPGGCYVEGDRLANRFQWKHAIGPAEERPGHWNLWGYRSTDGLGLFEYMQLAEELGAEAVWVINNGVAHADSVPTAAIQPYVQDALDSLEFVTGPSDSQWGSRRAAMGRSAPWRLNYLAIGNEDCGKPYYTQNYIAFFEALRAVYPSLRLIANCPMGHAAPTDLHDWHYYTDPATMFSLSTAFDGMSADRDAHVFASEYAVTTGGGRGNLIGAIAEAAFMTGLERNSEVVEMAAYAPLFVHAAQGTWVPAWPTNLIVFDSSRVYGVPSYHVQQLFSRHQGTRYVRTTADGALRTDSMAASATCQTDACERVALKVVSIASAPQKVSVTLAGLGGRAVAASGNLTVLGGGGDAFAENSFEAPLKVAPQVASLAGLAAEFELVVPPMSLSIVELDIIPGALGAEFSQVP